MKRFVLMSLAVVLAGGGCADKGQSVVARVGDSAITRNEFNRVLERQAQITGGRRQITDRVKAETLNALVDKKLLYLEGVNRHIQLLPAQLNAELTKTRSAFPDENTFIVELKRQGLTLDSFRQETVETVMAEQVRGLLSGRARVSEEEAEAYYKNNINDFDHPASYRIYLADAKDESAAQQLLHKYHSAPTAFDHFALEEVSSELRQINHLAKLTPQEDFPKEMAPLLDSTAIGQLGGPVRTKRGWFVFRLLEKKAGSERSWAQVKPEVTHLLFEEKRQQEINAWLAAQRKVVKIEIFAERL